MGEELFLARRRVCFWGGRVLVALLADEEHTTNVLAYSNRVVHKTATLIGVSHHHVPAEVVTTTLTSVPSISAVSNNFGMSSFVNKTWPMWFVPTCTS